jgi:hypothetical protein
VPRDRKAGRNDPCPCGSGKKFKQCCEAKADQSSRFWMFTVAGIIVAVVLFAIASVSRQATAPLNNRIWSAEHGHWHDVP